MNVTIEKADKTEFSNEDVFTCRTFFQLAPNSVYWEIRDNDNTQWLLRNHGSRLAVRELCLFRQWLWDKRSSSVMISCFAELSGHVVGSDVDVLLSDSEADKTECGL